jgi:uncharacterized protein (TIGR03435 family)
VPLFTDSSPPIPPNNPSNITTSAIQSPLPEKPPCYSVAMELLSRSDTARINGAKSRGPITPEGKARSSRNALKHGLTASFHPLPGESRTALQAFLAAHRTTYRPVGPLEEELVHSLAVTRWRLRRIVNAEFNVFDNQLCLLDKEIKEEFSKIDDPGRFGFVFQKLADTSPVLPLVLRYETSLTRIYDRTFKHLMTLQKLRNEPQPEPPAEPRIPEPPPTPRFEAASVTPNRIGNPAESAAREKITATPGALQMHNVSLHTCIKYAYEIRDFQISGPTWLASERFDITAKSSTPEAELRPMLRTLLADRFQLHASFESRNLKVYDLVASESGPRLQPSPNPGDSTVGATGGELVFQNYSMAELADRLASRPFKLDRPVIDRTQLQGRFDFALKPADEIETQLGLKLEAQQTPIEVLIIESVEKIPSGT